MRLQIEHMTKFEYDMPITEAYTEVRMRPLNDSSQRCQSFELVTAPDLNEFRYTDRFGNDVRFFDLISPHQALILTAISEVYTPASYFLPQPDLSPLDLHDYLMASPLVPLGPALHAFGQSHKIVSARGEIDVRATALALMTATNHVLKYKSGLTDVSTKADQALALGGGVCQDFTHVMLAACRSVGISSRYVSGYLYVELNNRQPNDPDPDLATHAWVDVYLPNAGWISLDPTHNCEQSERHIRLAVGRDYTDVPPTRGVYKGNAKEQMKVRVRVFK